MSYLADTINQFTAYISQNGTRADLEQRMQFYDQNIGARSRDFYHTVIDYDPLLVEAVKQLLVRIKIPPTQWDRYLNYNYSFYEILIHIKKQHPKNVAVEVDLFIELIEKKDRVINQAIVFNFLMAALFSIVLIAVFPPAFKLVKWLFNPQGGLPYISFIYNGSWCIYDFARYYFEKHRTLPEKLPDVAFLLTYTVLNSSAYVFWILRACTMTPLAAMLFVIASSVNVMKELFHAIRIHILYKKQPKASEAFSLSDQKLSVRLEYTYKWHRNAAAINCISSLLLLGFMAVWCFAPGGVLMVIGVIAAIVVVQFIQNKLLKLNKEMIRERLASELTMLEERALGSPVSVHANELVETKINGNKPFINPNPVSDKTHGLNQLTFFSSAPDDDDTELTHSCSTTASHSL